MASLTLYGGVGEVGGNKVLLRDGECRFFLDFGTPFARRSLFYEEYLQPRPGMGLLDPLEMGLLPLLRGIYRGDLELPGMWDHFRGHPSYAELQELDGVLVSHAHLDHCGYISFLKGEVPIFASALTAFIAKAFQDSGRSDMEHQICYLAARVEGVPKGWRQSALLSSSDEAHQRPFSLGDLSPDQLAPEAQQFWATLPSELRLSQDKGERRRKLKTRPLGSLSSSPLPLRCFPLDHSVPGACAWAVETAAGWVVYTGDIRFHGLRAALSHRFVEEASQLKPRALIAEGTYLERATTVSESQVLDNALRAAREVRGLIIADFAPRDIERLSTFLQVARETGRALVVLPRDAYLLDAIALLNPETPRLASEKELLIYQETTSAEDPGRWKKAVFERYPDKVVLARQVQRSQGDYILCFSFLDLNELPSIHPTPGSLYIYSSSEPHDEEQKIDLRRLHNWLKHFEICPFGVPQEVSEGKWEVPPEEEGLHASGHASGSQLVEMVKAIAPRTLIPIHAGKPHLFQEALRGSAIEVRLPGEGEKVPL